MPSVVDIYNNFLLSKGFFKEKQSRPLIEHSLNLLEDTSREGGVLFLQLPTGYGKTAITYTAFFYAITEPKFFWRVIHVAPLRSIVDDIHERMRKGFSRILPNDASTFKELVGAQMMFSSGSPYLQKRLTITTFDTLSLSLAKMPIEEISEIARGDGYGHFDIPRASILEALVVMDEIHTFLSEDEKTRAVNVLMSILAYLSKSRTPLVLMSATMPKVHVRRMLTTLKNVSNSFYCKEIFYGDDGIIDKDWENEQSNKRIETYFLKGDINNIVKKSSEQSSQFNRVLVVLNTIPRARQVYRELKEILGSSEKPLMLLHSKFRRGDRDSKLEIAKKREKWILISTQIIEAGVDISADVVITDIAPANSLVQRAGRSARWASDIEGTIVIVEEAKEVEQGFGIYDKKILEWTSEELKRYTTNGKIKIMWRNLDTCNSISYQKFVDVVYSKKDSHFNIDNIYYQLIDSLRWTSNDAVRCLINLYNGSFLRDSQLIPLIVGPLSEIDIRTLIENCVPIDLGDVGKMLRKGIKIKKVVRKEGEIKHEDLGLKNLNYLLRALIVGKVIALYVPSFETVYTKEEGLVIE